MFARAYWFAEGKEAYKRGYKFEDCPYDEYSEPHFQWCLGFKTSEEQDNGSEQE
jgi:hypothetical protein